MVFPGQRFLDPLILNEGEDLEMTFLRTAGSREVLYLQLIYLSILYSNIHLLLWASHNLHTAFTHCNCYADKIILLIKQFLGEHLKLV